MIFLTGSARPTFVGDRQLLRFHHSGLKHINSRLVTGTCDEQVISLNITLRQGPRTMEYTVYGDHLIISGGAGSRAGQKNKASGLHALKVSRCIVPGGGLAPKASPKNFLVHHTLLVST